MPDNEPGEIKMVFRYDNVGEEVSITVGGWIDPMIALAALRHAGSEENLNSVLNQMREQADSE